MSSKISHEELIRKFPDFLKIDESIRIHILEVFVDSANGSPKDISQKGCLELALKSNNFDQNGVGCLIWNSWREVFGVKCNKPDSEYPNGAKFYTERIFVNYVNFSGVDFNAESNGDFRYLNFSGFNFGDFANFSDAIFGERIRFVGSVFGINTNMSRVNFTGAANFLNSSFGHGSNFFGAKFASSADFRGVSFGDVTDFRGTQWGTGADFSAAKFGSYAQFHLAQWRSNVSFSRTTWGEGASFIGATASNMNFRNSRFKEGEVASFQGCNVSSLLQYLNKDQELVESVREFSSSMGVGFNELGKMDFSGAKFFHSVDFSNRKFNSALKFSSSTDGEFERVNDKVVLSDGEIKVSSIGDFNVVEFYRAPIFHGCELHQDTSFDGASFPPDVGKAEGTENAARAYRTLKLAFNKQQAVREEQRFFKLEMEEETLRETGLKRLLFWLYKWSSDYGFSIARPLLLFVVAWLGFAPIYGYSSGQEVCWLWHTGCDWRWDWLSFSFQQALPLPGFDKPKPGIDGVSVAWVAFHKTISLSALFLIGLALRNLFKLK